jgi:hypothetical protein
MNQTRFAFSFLYIGLGIAIIVRLLRFGLHRELFGGIVLGLVLIAFGVYRLAFYVRARRMRVES